MNSKLIEKCEKLAKRFKEGRTGQFIHWEPYIHNESLALGLANLASYADDPKRVTLEIDRLRRILEKEAP